MKISLNWLKTFINISKSAKEIEGILTEIGLEVDETLEIKPDKNLISKLIVGQIKDISKHNNADRLSVTKVDIGKEKLNIICGAQNIKKDQKVVVATNGKKLKNISNEVIEIKKTTIRGIESNGMICAEDEIGIGINHSGVIVLDKSAKIGESVQKYLEIYNDTIYDISLTPNRADAMSHLGVARDLKAVLNLKLNLPDISKFQFKIKHDIKIEIKNKNACPRYSGCVIDNIKVGESPLEIKNYLSSIGVKSINNVVDITNYVLHSIGQPLHAFDFNKIKQKKIIVKYAEKNEKFISLDGIERSLHKNDLMICDGNKKPMCIAGVFGGEKSGVSENTSTIFLESAYFNPSDVRKSSQNHQLKTDASYRFERGIDPNITIYALKYASMMLCKYCGGIVSSDIQDLYPNKIEDREIKFSLDRINKLIGKKIEEKRIINILESLDINVSKNGEKYSAIVPPYRVDVTREADLVEEILRIFGYNNIDISNSNKSKFLSDERQGSREYNILMKVMNMLVSNGYYEITTNSLTSNRYSKDKFWDDSLTIEMINKLSDEHAILKQDLLFTGLESIRHNINRKQKNLKLFEFDKIYKKENKTYIEKNKVGIYLTGSLYEEHYSRKESKVYFEDMINLVNRFFIMANINSYETVESISNTLQNCIVIKSKNKNLCKIGSVKENLLSKFDIQQEVIFAEINWDNYLYFFNEKFTYKNVPKFPEVKRDLSLILSDEIKFSEVMDIIEKSNKKIIKNVSLYDIYRGENIGKDKVTYSIRFILQDDRTTLDDKTINNTMDLLISLFEKKLNALIRR